MVAGTAGGLEIKEVTTHGTGLGKTAAGESAIVVGNAGEIGENLVRGEPGVAVGASETLTVIEALWVLWEDPVLEGFNVGSGEVDAVMVGHLEEGTSLGDSVELRDLFFSAAARDISSVALVTDATVGACSREATDPFCFLGGVEGSGAVLLSGSLGDWLEEVCVDLVEAPFSEAMICFLAVRAGLVAWGSEWEERE